MISTEGVSCLVRASGVQLGERALGTCAVAGVASTGGLSRVKPGVGSNTKIVLMRGRRAALFGYSIDR